MKSKLWILMAALTVAWAQDRGPLPLPASGNVTLPLDEYNRLVDLAANLPKKPDAPPAPYSIQSAELQFQVHGEAAKGAIQLDGEIFQKGALAVPLVSGMTVTDATRKGAELPLEQSGVATNAILSGPGAFSVTLDAGLPLRIESGRASLVLPVPAAGAARLTLTVPGENTVVNLNPGLITARRSAAGQTTVEAVLVPAQTARLWWAVRQVEAPAPPREVRFLSDVKTLVSVSEAELALTALVDLTVVEGDPAQFEIALPAGYELTAASGATLAASDVIGGTLVLHVSNSAQRSHQFLISLAKANSQTKAEIPILTVRNTRRETGEVLVEGDGPMELTATESGTLKRIDLKEASSFLRDLARSPLHAAFRYHRQESETPALSLAWVRFPNARILSAVVQDASATTLVTSDGKSLTEVKLTVDNQSQPFLKLALPAGASIVTAEVAGQPVKPVTGADGNRVPLLRSGFRPNGPYIVSFVYLDSGAPFARKGGSELALPKMDVPIGLVHWEVFLPERYKVTDFGGDVFAADRLPLDTTEPAEDYRDTSPGQIGGIVTDAAGGVVPNAKVAVLDPATGASWNTHTDSNGRWAIANLPPGRLRLTVSQPGFRSDTREIEFSGAAPPFYAVVLQVGMLTETIEVQSAAGTIAAPRMPAPPPPPPEASPSVVNLQKRLAGVLPIAIEVPRAGTSFRFIRPLVVDEETRVTFHYKTK